MKMKVKMEDGNCFDDYDSQGSYHQTGYRSSKSWDGDKDEYGDYKEKDNGYIGDHDGFQNNDQAISPANLEMKI